MVPSSTIITNAKVKTAEELTTGDMLLTDDGRFQRISEKRERDFSGDVVCITPFHIYDEIKMTPAHHVLIVRRHGIVFPSEWKKEWVSVNDVQLDDLLCIPVPVTRHGITTLTVGEFLGRNDGVCIENDTCYPLAKVLRRDSRIYYEKKYTSGKSIPNTIHIKHELLRLAGLYIAEGSASGRTVAFNFGYTERYLVAEVEEAMKNVFGISPCGVWEHKGASPYALTP
jgi:hypothetical protein